METLESCCLLHRVRNVVTDINLSLATNIIQNSTRSNRERMKSNKNFAFFYINFLESNSIYQNSLYYILNCDNNFTFYLWQFTLFLVYANILRKICRICQRIVHSCPAKDG